MGYRDRNKFSELMNKVIIEISGIDEGSDEIIFTCESGEKYRMWHEQDCCEYVSLNDVIGREEDLLNSPITMAEEVISTDEPALEEDEDSYTWTFYKLATVKGYVTLRWYGTSNGYYSETVDFAKVN